jgi:lysyl-tRNA synthetase class 2
MPSTVIRDFAYDLEPRVLAVQFMSGRTYVYYDVPLDVHAGLIGANSKGEYFNAHIRDRFDYREVVAD